MHARSVEMKPSCCMTKKRAEPLIAAPPFFSCQTDSAELVSQQNPVGYKNSISDKNSVCVDDAVRNQNTVCDQNAVGIDGVFREEHALRVRYMRVAFDRLASDC